MAIENVTASGVPTLERWECARAYFGHVWDESEQLCSLLICLAERAEAVKEHDYILWRLLEVARELSENAASMNSLGKALDAPEINIGEND